MFSWTVILWVLSLSTPLCGAAWTTYLSARYYSQTAEFDTFDEKDNSQRTHKYIYIRAGSSETAPIVESKFTTSSVPGFDSCDVDIRIYSGESEANGLFLGSLCGGAVKDAFQASHNAMLVVIDVAKIPDGFKMTVEYFTTKDCIAKVQVKTSPRYLHSPSYRRSSVGSVTDLLGCWWTLTAPSTHRISIKLHLSSPYNCDNSVSLRESESGYVFRGRVFATWCGGEDNTFVSYYSNVQVLNHDNNTLSLPPVGIEFKDIGADPCYEELEVGEGEEGFIKSPMFPNGVSDLKACKWNITTRGRSRGSLRFDVTSMSLADTPACRKDVVRVYDGTGYNSPVAKSWCGSDTSSADVFTSSVIVDYRTGVGHTADHAGFNIRYSYAQEPLCFHNLTSRSFKQNISSPGYPKPFRSFMKCKWLITTSHPTMVVKLYVVRTGEDILPQALCTQVRIYEGMNEKSPVAKEWCQEKSVTVQSLGQHLLLVFASENNELNIGYGFLVDYYEGQFAENVEVTARPTTVTFPNTPDVFYSADYDARWTLHTTKAAHHVAVKFTNVDVYCPSDSITIFDGGLGTSTYEFRFCGSDDHGYLSSSKKLTIIFKTFTRKGRGFTISYSESSYLGCFRNVQNVNVYPTQGTLSTPGLTYYDNMQCLWRLTAKTPSHRIKLHIQAFDIVTDATDRCTSDILKIYDGYDSNDGQLGPTICGVDRTWTMESSTLYMFIEFYTDEVKTGRGFNITFSSFLPEPDSSPSNDAVIAGVVVTLLLLIAIGIAIFVCYWRHRAFQRSQLYSPSSDTTAIQYTPQTQQGVSNPNFRRNRPDFSSVTAPQNVDSANYWNDQLGTSKRDEDAPPSYNNSTSEGGLQFVPRRASSSNV